MQGLIYKDVYLFFKSIEKRLLVIVGVVIIFLIVEAGSYSGFMASIMLAMTVGIQSVLSFASDEKANWKKYQMSMPISNYGVVASKYISIVLILLPCIMGSVILNLLSSVIYSEWNIMLWVLSILASILVPLIWAAICLPLTYWFGFRAAQTMGLICIFPMTYFINFFEDGPGLTALPDSMISYILGLCVICLIFFFLSFLLSVVGYSRKK